MAIPIAVGPWWSFVARGALAIALGVLALVVPPAAVLALVYVFGAYALAEGVLSLGAALERSPVGWRPRWALLAAGVASVLAALFAFFAPGLTALSLLLLVGAWAIVRGALEIVAAIALRRELAGEWLLALAGLFSVAFGVLVLAFPSAGALAIILWIGAYGLVLGALLVALGLRLRSRPRSPGPGGGFRELAPSPSR